MIHGLITIDPGYAKAGDGCACAYFRDGYARRVWSARPLQLLAPVIPAGVGDVDLVLVEEMQVRPSDPSAPDPRVLLRLQAEGCLLAGLYAGATGAHVELTPPTSWKGAVPKPVQHASLWKRLTLVETALLGGDATLARIHAAVDRGAAERWRRRGVAYYGTWQGHNTLDAVAMGVGRLAVERRQAQ
jgi:hypothetical protein